MDKINNEKHQEGQELNTTFLIERSRIKSLLCFSKSSRTIHLCRKKRSRTNTCFKGPEQKHTCLFYKLSTDEKALRRARMKELMLVRQFDTSFIGRPNFVWKIALTARVLEFRKYYCNRFERTEFRGLSVQELASILLLAHWFLVHFLGSVRFLRLLVRHVNSEDTALSTGWSAL